MDEITRFNFEFIRKQVFFFLQLPLFLETSSEPCTVKLITGGSRLGSGIETAPLPAIFAGGEEDPVVEAIGAVYPKLDAIGGDAIAAPVVGAWHFAGVLFAEAFDFLN